MLAESRCRRAPTCRELQIYRTAASRARRRPGLPTGDPLPIFVAIGASRRYGLRGSTAQCASSPIWPTMPEVSHGRRPRRSRRRCDQRGTKKRQLVPRDVPAISTIVASGRSRRTAQTRRRFPSRPWPSTSPADVLPNCRLIALTLTNQPKRKSSFASWAAVAHGPNRNPRSFMAARLRCTSSLAVDRLSAVRRAARA